MVARPAPIGVERRQHARLQHACPICSRLPGIVVRRRSDIAAELEQRERFFAPRLRGRFPRRSLRDVTEAALGSPAAVLRCERCDVLVREGVPDEELFSDDGYAESELESLHQTHLLAFRAKEVDYRPLLPPAARVVEVGSYAGGFLAAAAEWGWRAIGTDIGRDTVRFCRSLGLDVSRLHLEECELEAESLDGVFVWNCFEQLPDPCDLLAEAERVLRVGGLLVLRVPDAAFYLQWQQKYERASSPRALTVLAYNGILGWPHRFGYGIESLHRLVKPWPFAFCRALRRPVIRPLRGAMWSWAQAEEAALIRGGRCGWIELTFRKRDPAPS